MAYHAKKEQTSPSTHKVLDPEVAEAMLGLLEDVVQNGTARAAKALNRPMGGKTGTTNDFTVYFINVPANKLELWFWMESDRLLNPVFREFYKERFGRARKRYRWIQFMRPLRWSRRDPWLNWKV
jgi:membrane carboxypeptidase/penicillin-binding protein